MRHFLLTFHDAIIGQQGGRLNNSRLMARLQYILAPLSPLRPAVQNGLLGSVPDR